MPLLKWANMLKSEDHRKGIVFTPDDEPYLGRESVFHFDQVILSCLETNRQIAPLTTANDLTDLQKAAAQLIPQGINLALSTRELVRQGYLFGAAVLLRPLMERVAIISYLQKNAPAVEVWKSGWRFRERPSLATMLESMGNEKVDLRRAKEYCETLNHLVHGDPMSSDFNLVELGEGIMGYTVSKALNNPSLCDFICFEATGWLIVLLGMMCACFPIDQPSA